MTEKQKKLAIIIGTVILIIILLWSRKGGTITNTITDKQSAMPAINVSIPSMNIPERSPIAINIPALPAFSPYNFNAISPCMCNGASSLYSDDGYNGPLVEFVTNQGNSGPNIYNYYTPAPVTSNTNYRSVLG